MYPYLKVTILKHLEGKCIVKILSITWVNGKSKHFSHVSTLGNLFLLDRSIQALCIFFYFLRKLMRKSIFGQDGMYLCIMFPRLAKNLLYHSIGRIGTRCPLSNTYQDLIPIFSTITISLRYKNICIHSPIGRHYKSKILLHLYHPYKGSTLTLYDLGDFPFEFLSTPWEYVYFHYITM